MDIYLYLHLDEHTGADDPLRMIAEHYLKKNGVDYGRLYPINFGYLKETLAPNESTSAILAKFTKNAGSDPGCEEKNLIIYYGPDSDNVKAWAESFEHNDRFAGILSFAPGEIEKLLLAQHLEQALTNKTPSKRV